MATPQEHVTRIGEAVADLEEKAQAARSAARAVEAAAKKVHGLLEQAQADYIAGGGNVIAFSGGVDKPPVP